ncbi:hypothetical protein AB0C18_13140 [Nonomuraea muscovyensis]|uniref:hypothetical protein n=1 Tax=Nonomuraea muscovyensis TaxID=1124761 RepID=UPI0034113540
MVGESTAYQVPALLLPGPTPVVSPLIALQHDQVEALYRNGEAAASVDAGTSAQWERLRAWLSEDFGLHVEACAYLAGRGPRSAAFPKSGTRSR